MFSDADLNVLRQWGQADTLPVTLTVRTAPGPQSDAITAFAEALAKYLPCLRVKRKTADTDADPPALVITERLHYLATPLGPELAPFLDALLGGGHGLPPLTAAAVRRLSTLPLLARLEVFITAHCPFCPATVAMLLPLALADGPQALSVIDGALFPDLAAARDVRTAPTVILDGSFRWTQKAAVEEVVDVMVNREPARLGPDTLRSIIEDGKAAAVARMMADHGAVFDSLLPLLTHEKWPVRLGAMVVMEHFQSLRSDLSAETADRLWRLLDQAADPVKGDLLHVIGEIGDARQVPRLKALVDENRTADVSEAARDALESVLQRTDR